MGTLATLGLAEVLRIHLLKEQRAALQGQREGRFCRTPPVKIVPSHELYLLVNWASERSKDYAHRWAWMPLAEMDVAVKRELARRAQVNALTERLGVTLRRVLGILSGDPACDGELTHAAWMYVALAEHDPPTTPEQRGDAVASTYALGGVAALRVLVAGELLASAGAEIAAEP